MIFARQGYHGTSTREIARLSNLSEVTLFRHYENKGALFLDVLESNLDIITYRSNFLRKPSTPSRLEDMLPQIFALMHDLATYAPQVIKLIAIAYLEVHGEAEDICSTRLSAIFREVAGYLDKNMKTGRLRSMDPGMTAAAMALSAIAQAEIKRFGVVQPHSRSTTRKTIEEFATFWGSILIPGPSNRPAHEDTDLQSLLSENAVTGVAKA